MKQIILKTGQKLFWTSDTHFDHVNICAGTSKWKSATDKTRDFQTLDEMNQTLVDNINTFVGEDDILIHLGDFSFNGFDNIEKFRSQLNVKTLYLLLGNHDHHIANNKNGIQSIFTEVWNGIAEVNVRQETQAKRDGCKIICSHYPIASWNNMGDGWIHLHGHVHLPADKALGRGKSLDVGVDGNFYYPRSHDEIVDIMQTQPIDYLTLPQDHHTESN